MISKRLISRLLAASEERQVEDAYNEAIEKSFKNAKFTYPCKCDGVCNVEFSLTKGMFLIEYKYDENMKSAAGQAKVLAQVVFYLHAFETNGIPIPSVCFVADKNECFVMHTNSLLKYIDMEGVDWSMAPSEAWKCADMVLAISEDANLNHFVFDVDESFDFDAVAEKIRNLITGTVKLIRLNERNVDKIFKVFSERVLKEKVGANDAVGIFFALMTGDENTYLHPTKKSTLVHNGKNIRINTKEYKAFVEHFNTACSPREKARLAAISDRLVEDVKRRKKGEFYTPTAFVDYAHRRIEKVFGADWKEKYVVWDCAWGTGNLTRDYRFKELYCSTLEQAELEIGEAHNPEAEKFQFNFLDDDFEKLPDGLKKAFKKGKKILFLMNPPYATAGVKSTEQGKNKAGICQTMINKRMKADGMGHCSESLLAQFLYRVVELKKEFKTDISLCFFCKPIYLSGTTYDKFRTRFLREFRYEEGFLFNAGHFSDTASSWGINFSIWKSGETKDKNNFKHVLVDSEEEGEITSVGMKDIYNRDGVVGLPEWVGSVTCDIECPNMSSGIKVVERKSKGRADMIGAMARGPNSVQYSGQFVCLVSGVAHLEHLSTTIITPDNISRVSSAFAARKLIVGNWINDKDEYLAPDECHPSYEQFVNDSIVYSLFHTSSQQSSLRNIEYHGKKWDIKNEFFFMSREEMEDLADEHNLPEVYADAHTSEDRFVFKRLQDLTLSPEAAAVLQKARELVKQSMKFRAIFNDEHPEYQVAQVWDAGWYQVKAVLKEYMPNELKEFRDLYNKLADKMRPLVYELGFLRA